MKICTMDVKDGNHYYGPECSRERIFEREELGAYQIEFVLLSFFSKGLQLFKLKSPLFLHFLQDS